MEFVDVLLDLYTFLSFPFPFLSPLHSSITPPFFVQFPQTNRTSKIVWVWVSVYVCVYFVEWLPNEFSCCFSHEMWVFWSKSRMYGVFSLTYQGHILAAWFITVNADLVHPAEMTFVRSLHCEVILFLLSVLCCLEVSHGKQLTLKDLENYSYLLEGRVSA